MKVFTIRDVEESTQTFSGSNTTDVNDWPHEFEKMATFCSWTEFQKVIYYIRLLIVYKRLDY